MSFDLYVWGLPQPVTVKLAEQICEQLAHDHAVVVAADPRVEAFYQAVTERFPALEGLTDEALDDSPWCMSPGLSPSHLIMNIRWSCAQEVARWIIPLAAEHGLVCFDPQSGRVHNPPRPDMNELRLEFYDGSMVDSPAPADLRRLLQALSERNWYASLEKEPDWFVQVGVGQQAGDVPEGHYAVEYREGAPDRHYRTLMASLDDVAAVFVGFATDDQTWKNTSAWTQLLL
ncbi:hypothetical protein [Actinopolymorpha alba]|uniref:hypothetical protein n=1 Tax=Actinopolymorpha alba TaxID=533267 RepID=UPI0003624666|nr:hypothetical protein [Actinopolymorpha alba]